MTYCFIVLEDFDGLRVDSFLKDKIPDLSRTFIQKLCKSGNVQSGTKALKASAPVHVGDKVTIEIPDAAPVDIVPENIPLDIVYEDSDILIVNKPQGMVVHPSCGHPGGTLVNALMYHCGGSLSGIGGVERPGIVHRIDKDTSGLLVVCKNDVAHQNLARQFSSHSIHRVYECIATGCISEDGTIDAPVGRHKRDRKKMSVECEHGKRAVTHYHVIDRFQKHTYLSCTLETGRTHQIRVHLASMGHPILGDGLYGHLSGLNGQTLHAKELGFVHPVTGRYMEFDSKLPEYFQKILLGMH